MAAMVIVAPPTLGNYMQMMSVLEPIAYDALEYLTHLFDYYLFAVSVYMYP